ncbi:MAG: hypothetical protein ABSG75_14595 [Syntrophales bacterium]|jgi:hypothetical protein
MEQGFITRSELRERWPNIDDGQLKDLIVHGQPKLLYGAKILDGLSEAERKEWKKGYAEMEAHIEALGITKPYIFRAWDSSYKPIEIVSKRQTIATRVVTGKGAPQKTGKRTSQKPAKHEATWEVDDDPFEKTADELYKFLPQCFFKLTEVQQLEQIKPKLLWGAGIKISQDVILRIARQIKGSYPSFTQIEAARKINELLKKENYAQKSEKYLITLIKPVGFPPGKKGRHKNK